MWLSRIDIRRLGQIRDLSIDPLSPQLNVVYGPNEAGKSTIRDAVRYALFGFPATKPSKDAVDVRSYVGVDREVALRFTGDGQDLHIARVAEGRRTTAGDCTVSPSSAKPVFDQLVAGIDDRQYHTMWSVSLANLAGIDPARDSGRVLSALLAAEHGTAVSPGAAIAQLDTELNRIFSPPGKQGGPSMKSTTDDIVRLKEELAAARREASGIASLRHELDEISAQLDAATTARRDARAQQSSIAATRAELVQLAGREAELDAQLTRAEEEYRIALQQVGAADSPTLRRILSVAEEVHAVEAGRALAEDRRAEADRLDQICVDLKVKLGRYDDVPDLLDDSEAEALVSALERLERQISRTSDDLKSARTQIDVERAREATSADSSAVRAPRSSALLLVAAVAAGLGSWLFVATSDIVLAGVTALVLALSSSAILWWALRPSAPAATESDSARLAEALAVAAARQSARADAVAAWHEYVGSRPLLVHHLSRDPEQLIALVKQSSTKASLAADLASYARQLERAQSVYQSWVERAESVRRLAQDPGSSQRPSLSQLSDMVHEAELVAARAAQASEALPRAAEQLEAATKARAENTAALTALIERCGADSATGADAVLVEQAEHIDGQVDMLDSTIGQLGGRRGEIFEAIRTAESSHGIERLAAELAFANQRLESFTRSYVISLLAKTMLERGVAHFAGEGSPGVMDSASKVFAQLTGGSYSGIESPEGDDQNLYVVGADGARKTVDQLSVGTVEQLYLAIRFGALLALPTRGRNLPVLLDEVLANYDAARAEYAFDAIAALAANRQVIYFTCQEKVASGLARAAANRGIDYARVSMDGGHLTK